MTTFETTKKLKDAGFLQPEFEWGQFWYDENAGIWITGNYPTDKKLPIVRELSGFRWEWIATVNGFVFAPTATDILQELGFYYSLIRDVSADNKDIWLCMCEMGDEIKFFHHENPAEACALAWLERKAKIESSLVKEAPEE